MIIVVREILLLGDPALYEVSRPIEQSELPTLAPVVADLRDTLLDFRAKYRCGRAIAAPQIGVQRRLIYRLIDGVETVFINPVLSFPDEELMEVLDDCMSFPALLVRVMRHRRCVIEYRDLNWAEQRLALEGDLSELIQHEYDHLDGILATLRAVDDRALVHKKP